MAGQKLPATIAQYFKQWKPRTPGLRNRRLVRTDHLHQDSPPIGSLLTRHPANGGRCSQTGRITTRHRGGACTERHSYRLLDFNRRESPFPAKVVRLEVDPNRSAHIALLKHTEGTSTRLSYILATKGMQVGDKVWSGPNVAPDRGNVLPLSAIPAGTLIHNIGLKSGEHGKIARSAGTYAQLLRTGQRGWAQVKMCSGEIRLFPVEARATIGTVSNPFHKLQILGTAGARRRLGRRPRVRGVAMNACDHPMGGAGRRRGIPSTSPWGKITKGVFTVKKERQPYVIQARPTRNARKRIPTRSWAFKQQHSDIVEL